jgi:predicted HTH domain antitoxin
LLKGNLITGGKMGLQITIPDSIIQAIRLPEDRISQELMIELAISTYSQGLLSFGKARELASLGKFEFAQLLGRRGILRHYSRDELEDDLRYARSE